MGQLYWILVAALEPLFAPKYPYYRVWWDRGKFGPFKHFKNREDAFAFYWTAPVLFYPYKAPVPEPPGKGVTWFPGSDFTAYPRIAFHESVDSAVVDVTPR